MMDNKKENLFKLQVFQQTISTIYMYPLRIYNNDCCEKFQKEMLYQNDIRKLHQLLLPNQPFNPHHIIEILQKRVKEDPQSICSDSEIYKLLESHAERLKELMWETHASNSLTFTREIKSNRRLWLFLMIYDIYTKEFIDENFEEPFFTKCLIDMQSIYVRLNEKYTLSIGRIFVNKEEYKGVVENILRNYDFDNMNVFELTTLARKRMNFQLHRVEKETKYIKKAFQLFLESISILPNNLHKEELEKVFVFIYMVTKNDNILDSSIKIKEFILSFKDEKLSIHPNVDAEFYSDEFLNIFQKFENNRDFFRSEYASRLKSTLTKRYTGLKGDAFSAVKELLKHICSRVNADGGCYIKYTLSDKKLEMMATHGDLKYEKGMEKFVREINNPEKDIKNRSRVMNVIKRYQSSDGQYDIDKIILKNIHKDDMLQPVEGKAVLSNIALPITFKQKLLGVLLIDSFRVGNFTDNDINLILSITSALSVQIFDQIVQENLSAIMNNLPQKPTLDDETIQRHFQDLTTYMNNIFFSHGIAIWDYDKEETIFKLKSTTLDIENIADCIIKEESNDLIFDLLKIGNIDKVESYDVKESNRLSVCNPLQYDERLNCVKIYAITDGEELIGAFSVYNQIEEDYKSIDEQSLKSVINHLAIFFNIMNTIKAQRALVQSQALHEISARFNMLDNKTKQLRELVNLNFKELEHYARFRFKIKLDDIDSLVSNTRLAFQYIANKTDKIKYENSVDKEIVHLYKPLISKNIEVNNIRHIFNELTNSIPFPYSHKNIRINNMIDNQLNVKIHSLILSDIFQNILLNAVKYSFQGTTIRIFSKIKRNSINISIKNNGLEIRRGEEIDIFKYGYRGFSARGYEEDINGEKINYKSREDENLGIGLYKCNEIVKKILGGEIRLKREVSVIKNIAVNTFEIIIPIDELRGEEE
jgi:signal transduction histidine kinase